jgi:S-adenosylmethionine uptake transporter
MRSGPNPSAPWLPIVAAACGIATFSVMDALMKGASQVAGVYAAMVGRNLVGVVVALAAWQIGFRGGWPKASRLRLHAARALIAGFMGFCFFWGLVRVPMAVGMGLSFVAPIIALYLSAFFLGEAVTRRALVASLLGLAGVVVIALEQASGRSGDEALIGMGAILLSSVLYAINLVMQRHQAQLASPGEIAFFQNLFITLALLPVGFWLPPVPPVGVWWQVSLAALLSVSSLMLMAWGWARAPAHQLLPMEYSAFVWAALAGWLWFGESLGLMTLAGVCLIVGGCLYGSRGRADNCA